MADGRTRKIKFVYYDDGYNPVKAVQNYGKLTEQDHIFALFQTFGTPTNVALMKKANADGVPEAYVNAGDGPFSDRAANPWTIGWQPTYQAEGVAYGEHLAAQGKPLTVAVLRQADSFGEAHLEGLREGVKGSQVKITKVESYTATDATVDSQMSSLSTTRADVLYLAVVPRFAAGAVNHASTLGWKPTIYLPSVSSSISQVVTPGRLGGYPELYTTSFVKRADDPRWVKDPAIQDMTAQMKKYAPDANPATLNSAFTYAAAMAFVEALKTMKSTSRKDLMDALNALKTSDVGLLLPGITVDGTDQKTPPVTGLKLEHFKNGSWTNIEK
jgi:branched-chain amino acid transport system substrate-binding protein